MMQLASIRRAVSRLAALSVIVLAAAGIHALMSFTVTRRRSIFSRALLQLAIGVVLGLGGGRLFLGSEGNHAIFLSGVVAFVTLVGLVAALGPARRGLRIGPSEALRGP